VAATGFASTAPHPGETALIIALLEAAAGVQFLRPAALREAPWLSKGLLWLVLGVVSLLLTSSGSQGLRRIPFVGVCWALLCMNVLAPQLIDRWRGTGLLYPSAGQLWRARLLWTPLFIALAALLTLLARILLEA
jgi:hypothetical protein